MKISELEEKFRGHTPGIIGDPARYAVLVPLVEVDGQAHLLFEVRADGMKHQPGEVCFPGGKMEPGEDPETCALRETGEELGISAEDIEVISHLDAFHDTRRVIHPVLAKVKKTVVEHIVQNPAEVKETFLAPADFFVETPPYIYRIPMEVNLGEEEANFNALVGFPDGYPWGKRKMVVPAWRYKDWVIWGLTGRILMWTFRPEDWN